MLAVAVYKASRCTSINSACTDCVMTCCCMHTLMLSCYHTMQGGRAGSQQQHQQQQQQQQQHQQQQQQLHQHQQQQMPVEHVDSFYPGTVQGAGRSGRFMSSELPCQQLAWYAECDAGLFCPFKHPSNDDALAYFIDGAPSNAQSRPAAAVDMRDGFKGWKRGHCENVVKKGYCKHGPFCEQRHHNVPTGFTPA
jgi:hypothetical protein